MKNFIIFLLLIIFPLASYGESLELAKKIEIEKLDAISWKRLECKKNKGFICSETGCIQDIENNTNDQFVLIFDRPRKIFISCYSGSKEKCTSVPAIFLTRLAITRAISEAEYAIIEGKDKFAYYTVLPSDAALYESNLSDQKDLSEKGKNLNLTSVVLFGSCHETD